MNKTLELLPCPFCNQLPEFQTRGQFIRGGCEEHLPDAVMQPVTLPDEAVKQWNNVIEILTRVK